MLFRIHKFYSHTSVHNVFTLHKWEIPQYIIMCLYFRLLGVDKLFSYAINEWLNDIKKNQLPGLLGGVGPIHSLVQLGEYSMDSQLAADVYWWITHAFVVPDLKMKVLFSSGIQGPGLAPYWAVQKGRPDSAWVSAGHSLFWNFDCNGCPRAHQQDGADYTGNLPFTWKKS